MTETGTTKRWRIDLECGHHFTSGHQARQPGYLTCTYGRCQGQRKITAVTAVEDPAEAQQQPGGPAGTDPALAEDPPADLEPGEYRQAE
jgi:hypothetical protein